MTKAYDVDDSQRSNASADTGLNCENSRSSHLISRLTFTVQVIAYWQRWMERWPTISDLAKADVEVRIKHLQ